MAEKITQDSVQEWLEGISGIASLDTRQETALLAQLGGPALEGLVGLMMGARNGLYIQLTHLPLDNPAAVARASVIQGQIKGIETLRSTLLELVTPTSAGTEGANP